MATSCPSAAPHAPSLFQILINFLFIWRKQINNSNCSLEREREAAEGWNHFNLASAGCLGHALGLKLCSDRSFALFCSSSVLLILGVMPRGRWGETSELSEDGQPCEQMCPLGPVLPWARRTPETPKDWIKAGEEGLFPATPGFLCLH